MILQSKEKGFQNKETLFSIVSIILFNFIIMKKKNRFETRQTKEVRDDSRNV